MDTTMTANAQFGQIVLPVILLTGISVEVIWSMAKKRHVYNLRESLNNVSIQIVSSLLKPVAIVWSITVVSLFEPLQIFSLPNTAWAWVLSFVITDLAFYGYHRMSHEIPLLWTMHHTHHSSPWLNLTTAMRLNWVAKFVSPVFFAPLVLLGLSPIAVGVSLALGLFYQLLLHTEMIGQLGWFEGKLLNTPSAHRVHHGRNEAYIDKNYAGVFIVWDRLFGTYEPECEPVRYGVTTGFVGHNPLFVQFQPLWKYIRGEWRREKPAVAARPETDNEPAPEGQRPAKRATA